MIVHFVCPIFFSEVVIIQLLLHVVQPLSGALEGAGCSMTAAISGYL